MLSTNGVGAAEAAGAGREDHGGEAELGSVAGGRAAPAGVPDPELVEQAKRRKRERVLEVLHCERFVDVAPEETYATLLDEGSYLCSTRTMYRILAAHHGGVRERRAQLTHPPYTKPELLAQRPKSCGAGTRRS